MPATKTEKCIELNRRLDKANLRIGELNDALIDVVGTWDFNTSKTLQESITLNISFLKKYLGECILPYKEGDVVHYPLIDESRVQDVPENVQKVATVIVMEINYPKAKVTVVDESLGKGSIIEVDCSQLELID
ncbi:hypothetical protein HON36_03545 [Candidatus Parcubacteria bacterium]|jgi:hypothetical protein|nr:hypothetical protein [Candidatus Parcubacteria bacterium]MBT7228359.1 hypothetical protein [Candidatus Parcubacteria bacterium]